MEVALISNKRRINEKNLLSAIINLDEFIFSPENRSQAEGLVDHRILEELHQSTTRLLSIALPDSADRKKHIFIFFICICFMIVIGVELFKFLGFI